MIEKKIILDKLFSYYEKYGQQDYIGEEITQNEHMIQGAMFAEQDNQPIEIVVSLFLHDIGHLLELENDSNEGKMGDLGALNHESKGRLFLENLGIPYPIPNLVENHVISKRYLITKNPEYFNKLSDASKQTFEYQGGILTNYELEQFENDPLFKMSLKVREYDEKSKIKNIKLKPLSYYRTMIGNLL